jgi:hypothetical protein
MTDAQLRDQGVNRPRLNSAPAAAISNFRGRDMIVTIRHQKREGREVSDNLFFGLGTGEPLQKFLKDQTGRQNSFTALERPNQRSDLGSVAWLVTA